MNLTKWFAAGLCITAMTVSAGIIKTNSFEGSAQDSAGWFVGETKNLDSTGIAVANDTINKRGTYSGDRPMPTADNQKVLKLDESVTFTNSITGALFNVSDTSVYVDMLVKFVPSDSLPLIGTNVKLAVAVLGGTPDKLAISVIDIASEGSLTNAWIVADGAVDTNVWCRLTVELLNNEGYPYANIKTNGVLVNASPYPINAADKTLNAISFSGTGYIDEVVVTTDNPFGSLVADLTLDFTTGIQSVYVNGSSKNTTDKVPSGSELVITAKNWYEIASVTGPATTNWLAGAVGSTVATVKVENATATNVTITGRTSTSTAKVSGSTSFTNQPMDKVAAWANGVGNLTGDVDEGMYNRYLLNLEKAATVPTMLIKSISVSGTTATVTVEATGVDFSAINGVLKFKTYVTLDAVPTPINVSFTGGPTSTITIEQDIVDAKFIKVSVE